jgi:uncharacterized protein (TIGR02147 family)
LKKIYQYSDYKTFLKERLADAPNSGRGMRSKLAAHLKVQNAYLSQVLNGNAHLSLEQADLANQFLELDPDECRYFITLVGKDRAGTTSLLRHFEGEINRQKKFQRDVASKFQKRQKLTVEDESIYFSIWYFVAIHHSISIEGLQTEDALIKKFGLPKWRVREALQFLTRGGLIKKTGEKYVVGKSEIFLSKDSPLFNRFHSAWRLQSIRSSEYRKKDDLFYTSVVVGSEASLELVRSRILEVAKEVSDITDKDQKFEKLMCLGLDWFEV